MSKAMFEVGDIVRVTDDKAKLRRDVLYRPIMRGLAGKKARITCRTAFGLNIYKLYFFEECESVRCQAWFLTEDSLCSIEKYCDTEDNLDWASDVDISKLIAL